MTTFELLLKEKLVIISRGVPKETLLEAAEALADAGIRFLESTFDHRIDNCIEENAEKIAFLKKRVGDRIHIGAGTVLNVKEVQAAFDAGCEYIIAPNTKEAVVKETKRLGMYSMPGAATATEICDAWDMGADMVKFFPADDLGMHYITNLRGPLPHIPLMATGGVNPQTIPEFLKRGINAVGTGITVLRPDLVQAKAYAAISALAKEHIQAVKDALK